MPIYTYRCDAHDIERDKINTIANHKNGPDCPECGEPMRQKLTPPIPSVVTHFKSFESPIDGKVINSDRQLKNELRKHDCVIADKGRRETPRTDWSRFNL